MAVALEGSDKEGSHEGSIGILRVLHEDLCLLHGK